MFQGFHGVSSIVQACADMSQFSCLETVMEKMRRMRTDVSNLRQALKHMFAEKGEKRVTEG
jgi:hypothetical protein